jgi:IS4 transposase
MLLPLSLFPWAKFRRRKGAVKLHTLLDLRGNIPTVIIITHGLIHENNILDQLTFEAGAFYLMDRAYLDFPRLHRLHLASAFFVTRSRKRFAFRRLRSLKVDRTSGIRCDQVVTLDNPVPREGFPDKLRRIKYFDAQRNKRLIFLTNNFTLPALTIAELYRSRWQVELFFKWIKQHLRIKKFYGTSENALKTQIWIAISIYVLVAIVKKQLNLDGSLYTTLQILSVNLFDKTPLLQALSLSNYEMELLDDRKQLILFD